MLQHRMAAHTPNINVHVNKFETTVFTYMDYRGHADQPQLKRNIQDLHDWASEGKFAAATDARNQKVNAVANILITATGAIEKFSSGDTLNIMQGCLEIIGSATALIGGPYGIVAGAICSILGGILSAPRGQKPDIVTQLHKVVHAELLQFHQRLVDEKFSGLQLLVANLMRDLNGMSSKKNMPSGAESVPNYLLQFIGEVADGFVSKPVGNTEEDRNDGVRAMVIYSLAQTCTQSLLTTMRCKYNDLKLNTRHVDNMMDTLTTHAKESLSFLSDERYLGMEGMLNDNKLNKMMGLRNNNASYRIVEQFRVSMHMTKMPSNNELQSIALTVAFSGTKLKIDGHPNPHERGDNHYIQFINETDFPMKVVSGIVGDNINNLKFNRDIEPRRSYERPITKSTWNFSAGGYIVVYLDGQMQHDEEPFEGDFKAIAFALSNPFIGTRKTKMMDKTGDIYSIGECWSKMDGTDMTPIRWVHNSTFYMASGGYTMPGRNGCLTWRYVVQDYSPNEDSSDPSCVIS